MKLYILLPSYNEEEALPCLLKSIYCSIKGIYDDYEVIVINDGSQDNTERSALLWEGLLDIRVISHEKNKGLGEAVKTGLSYFYDNCSEDDVAIIMDADNTHNPELIPLMISKANEGSDVVIASRYQDGGREIGLSPLRRLCSAAASLLLSVFFSIPNVKDYTCGYRLYKGSAIKRAYELFGEDFIKESGFTCMAEILIKLSYIGCDISEVPLVLRYDLKKGKSKMKVLSTIKRYFVLINNSRHFRQYLNSLPVFINGKEK